MNIRLSTIFDIPLAQVLKDNSEQLTVISPSAELQEVFSFEKNIDVFDVHISDMDNKAGIEIRGSKEKVKEVMSLLLKELPHTILFHKRVEKDSIYHATIEKVTQKNLVFLNLGSMSGIMFGKRENEYFVGSKVIVQIKELPVEQDKLPICSEELNLSGDFAVLERSPRDGFVRVSKQIKGKQRDQFFKIGQRVKPDGFGIIIRTSAVNVTESEIQKEVSMLVKKWHDLSKSKMDAGQQIATGDYAVQIAFSYVTKRKLDEIRENLIYSVPDYYTLRAYSIATSFALELAMRLKPPAPAKHVSEILYDMIFEKDFALENYTRVTILDINGNISEEYLGNLAEIDNKVFRFRLTLDEQQADENPSNYIMYENDYIDVFVKQGSWCVYYRYYSGDAGLLIGERVRIILPVNFAFRGKFTFNELGIDIYLVNEKGGDLDIVYKKKLHLLQQEGAISQTTLQKIEEVIQTASENLKNKDIPFQNQM